MEGIFGKSGLLDQRDRMIEQSGDQYFMLSNGPMARSCEQKRAAQMTFAQLALIILGCTVDIDTSNLKKNDNL